MPPNSLRLQLLGWLLGPLAVVVAVNTWAIYTNATETATVVQDRMLLGAVRIIAEQTYYKDGELHVEVAQTMRAHRTLASQIWKQAVRQELLMLALAIALVWLGLRRGLTPVLRLRDQVLRRKPGTLEPLDAASAPRELAPLVDAMNDY